MDPLDRAACWADLEVAVVACHVCAQDYLARLGRLVCTFQMHRLLRDRSVGEKQNHKVPHKEEEAKQAATPHCQTAAKARGSNCCQKEGLVPGRGTDIPG